MTTLCETVRKITGAESVSLGKTIQSLWSGYGVIQRASLGMVDANGLPRNVPVVIKHIDISSKRINPRGWGSERSHQRKVHSYRVEKTFYECFSDVCDQSCWVPQLLAAHERENSEGWLIVLTDLDDCGFNYRKSEPGSNDVRACLSWLANFHATFLGNAGEGLWPIGTYWHLQTRPDELSAMRAGPLKQYAQVIDNRLNSATFQTLVHGDAKVANFCFPRRQSDPVAAVDFQYVGRGCGMKDVAYFISSCLSEEEAAKQEEALLGCYFQKLQQAIASRGLDLRFSDLEDEWRSLYLFAWADFCRFLSGWSPGHWKLNSYTERITKTVTDQLRLE